MPKKSKGYAGILSQSTPQSQQAHPAQVPNSANGYSFPVDHWERLRRFLILGSEDGTYYISERELTLQNAQAVQTCLKENGIRTVQFITAVSLEGRAAKNSPAILALAMATSPKYADAATNKLALNSLSVVCRTLTMLYEFCETIQRLELRGWGRGLRTAVSNWFTEKKSDALAYQLVKYRQRNGWTARDVLRLAHPNAAFGKGMSSALRWAITGMEGMKTRQVKRGEKSNLYPGFERFELPPTILAFEAVQEVPLEVFKGSPNTAAHFVKKERLPREALPTAWLNEPVIWGALLDDMPYMATLRNLATMTRVGLLANGGDLSAIKLVCDRLVDPEQIKKSRVHPIAILAASLTYAQGKGMKSDKTWQPNARIIAALNQAFYTAFANVAPYEGSVQIAIDVSTSMHSTRVNGLEYLSAVQGAAALALPMLKAMPNAFTTAFNTQHQSLTLHSGMSLDEAVARIDRAINGGTDCAAPIRWALHNRTNVDLFVILTDSETWAGQEHPFEALRAYRANVNPNAKLAVVAMCANGFSLNSPEDKGSMDLVGFDTHTPMLLDAFARGEI